MIDARKSTRVYEEKNWRYHKVFANWIPDVASKGKLVSHLKDK
jgi:hypothetical protein